MSRKISLRRAFLRSESGATAVEFSIVAIPLLLTLFGCIEFGRMLWTRQSMSEVAVMAARCMGLPQTECSTSGSRDVTKSRTYAIGVAAKWGLTLTTSEVVLDSNATCGGATGFSRITVTHSFATVAPKMIQQLANNPMTVSACFPNGSSS